MIPTCIHGAGLLALTALVPCASALQGDAAATTELPEGIEERDLEAARALDVLAHYGLNLYGFIQLDAFANTDRVEPDWVDVVRPSTLATSNNPGAFGGGGEFGMSIRASQFGAKGQFEAGEHDLKTWFEFDLLETGNKAGETGLHIRHAWGEWGNIGAGQTHSSFMDIGIFPANLEYWGPPGMVFNRNPQIRYTQRFEDSRFAVGLEQQNRGIDAGIFTEISPDFGMNVQAKSVLPDLTTHYRAEHDRGHWQVAGVLRELRYETRGTPGNDPSGSDLGWGVNLSTAFKTTERDTLKLQLVFGEGIASYMNDGGSNIAPQDGEGEAVGSTGLVACYEHKWAEQWTSAFCYSFNDMDNTNQQSDDAFSKGEYATASLMHTPNEHIRYAVEFYWFEREDKNGATGDSSRLQFTIQWDFSLGAIAPSFDT